MMAEATTALRERWESISSLAAFGGWLQEAAGTSCLYPSPRGGYGRLPVVLLESFRLRLRSATRSDGMRTRFHQHG